MLHLYIVLFGLVCALVLISLLRARSFKFIKFREDQRPKRKATMFDVRNLLMKGRKEAAIQIYCEIFNTTPEKARKDIEELERSLKV